MLKTSCVPVSTSRFKAVHSRAYRDGQEEARKDINAGESKYLLYGQPQAHDRLFAEILKEDYKITLVIVGGCTVAQDARDRADGYNKVMQGHLAEKWKKDVIKEAEAKARRQWEQEHARNSRQ